MDWSKYPNFSAAEMRCKHTGKVEMHPDFMERLQALREAYGKPMRITSGFRDRTHPAEASKRTTGAHTTGRAVDIAVQGKDALDLVAFAIDFGFTGIGIKQHGGARFVHLDDLEGNAQQPRPTIWSYP
jgi:zinc D-Ala-D-Ala carboxypeptidase